MTDIKWLSSLLGENILIYQNDEQLPAIECALSWSCTRSRREEGNYKLPLKRPLNNSDALRW